MPRKALLLGLDTYEDTTPTEKGLKLTAPKNDVASMSETLIFLGYRSEDIAATRSSEGRTLTTSTLRRIIRNFLKDASGHDELLLYISGHGADQDGQRVVIPVDYYRDDPQPASHLLSDQWLYDQARSSPAASVLIVVDACREPVKLKLEVEAKGLGSLGDSPRAQDTPTIAILYSTQPHHWSYADSGPEGVSFFTQALCDVLKTDERVATLGDLITAIETHLPEILPRGHHQTPFLDERFQVPGRSGPALQLIVKEDQGARLRQKIEASLWCKEILQACPHWQLVVQSSRGLALQIQTIVQRAEDLVGRAAGKLPDDRWRIDDALTRLLSELLPENPGVCALGLYFSVPFVYEAVLACLVIRLAEAGSITAPQDQVSGGGVSKVVSAAWSQALRLEEDWARRREHLVQTGAVDTAADIFNWQLWSFAHRAGELWRYSERCPPGAVGWVNDLLDELFAAAPLPEVAEDSRIPELLSGRRLARLGRLLFAEPQEIDGEATRERGGLAGDVTIGRGADLWRVNEVEIAHVLAFAGRVALDARLLPQLVVEHLGLDAGFDLATVQAELKRTRWQRINGALVLSLETPYPALHAALAAQVDFIENYRHRLEVGRNLSFQTAQRFPKTVLDTKLLPATASNGQYVFDPRHLSFALDQQRIINLLMGEQLCGKPEWALRELYQNALDACRYRRAREQFIEQSRGAASSYEGRIVLEAGFDNTRPFIACTDDGIGMGEQHLRELFARAGRRFAQSHEYHLDKAQWQEAGIQFWPNSRFGIGVLSYFMLAEDILLETRRLEPDGNTASEGLTVRITGSGSLFRITKDRAVQRREGGTRITLFLKDSTLDPNKLLYSVREWLWLPEVDTLLKTASNASELLPAGEPTPECRRYFGQMIPVPSTRNSLGQPRAFWIPDFWKSKSASDRFYAYRETPRADTVLVDGIKTYTKSAPAAILLNLSENIAGTVTVDRRSVTLPGDIQSWLEDRFLEDDEVLFQWAGADLADIAELADAQPNIMMEIDRRMRNGQIAVGIARPGSAPPHAGLSLLDRTLQSILTRSDIMMPDGIEKIANIRLMELGEAGMDLGKSLDEYCAYTRQSFPVCEMPLSCQILFIGEYRLYGLQMYNGGSLIKSITMSISDLAWAIAELHLTPDHLIEMTEPLYRLQLTDGDEKYLQNLRDALCNHLDIVTKLFCSGTFVPGINAVGPVRVAKIAMEMGIPIQEVADKLRPLVKLGLISADLDALSGTEVIDTMTGQIVEELDARPDRGPISAVEFIGACARRRLNQEAMTKIGRTLSACGLMHTDFDEFNQIDLEDKRLVQLISRNLDGTWPYVKTIGAAHLIKAHQRLGINFKDIPQLLKPYVGSDVVSVDLTVLESLGAGDERIVKLFQYLSSVNSRIDAIDLIRASLDMDLAPAVIAELARPLAKLGLITADLDIFAELKPFESELDELIKWASGRNVDLDLGELLLYVLNREVKPEQVSRIVAPLKKLNVLSLNVEKFAKLPAVDPLIMTLFHDIEDVGAERPTTVDLKSINAAHLHRVAVAMQLPAERLVVIVRPLIDAGLVNAELDLNEFALSSAPHPLARRLLSLNFDGSAPWRVRLSAFDLAIASHRIGVPVLDLRQPIRDLERCGVDVDDVYPWVRRLEYCDARP